MILSGLKIDQLLDTFKLGRTESGEPRGMERFASILKGVSKSSAGSPAGENEAGIRGLAGLKGEKFIEGLKSLLKEKGIDPSAAVNEAALNAVGQLLVSAGHDSKQVAGLLQDLRAGSGKSVVRLSDLLEKISKLDKPSAPECLLGDSALPFVQSILSILLPEPDKQLLALNGAKLEGDRIDVSRLAANLDRIVQGMPDRGRSLPDPAVQRQIAKLMNGLGMPAQEGAVTLDRFVSELRAMISGNTERLPAQRDASAQLNRFMENISSEKNPPGKPADTARFAPLQKDAPAVHAGKSIPEGKTQSPEDSKSAALMAAGENGTAKTTNPPAAAATTEAKPQVRTLPAYVVQQVSRQILGSHQNGTREIHLQLHPPNLGRIHLNIDSTGDAIRVQIVTERQGAQELLTSHSGDLKAVLSEQGLRLEKVDVQYDHFFDQSLADARQYQSRSRGQRQRESGGRDNREIDSTDSPAAIRLREERLLSGEGLLDLVA